MTKKIPCPDCNGRGYICGHSEYSTWSEVCANCHGTGIIEAPMANADRIRAMSDEELVNWLVCPYDIDPDLCIGRGTCYDCTLQWLRQPAKEESK